jgi:hypothetical protein
VPDTQNPIVEEEKEKKELINKTLALCKTFFFPLLALLSRSTGIKSFKRNSYKRTYKQISDEFIG